MRVGIVGDPHEPFCHPMYRRFCLDTFAKYRVNKVVFIGDLGDNHAISFHDHDPDLHSPNDELKMAQRKLRPWVRAIPNALVTIGNHDDLPARQAQANGLPGQWLREYKEVWNTPGWDWGWDFQIDGNTYTHGTGLSGKDAAINYAIESRASVIIGHLHSNAGAKFHASRNSRIFGLSVGCGVDDKARAFAYGKFNVKRSLLGCGIVLDGDQPIFVPMAIGRGEKYNRRRAGKKRRRVLV